ncbi:hypothetical protein K2173_009806 [Erythroxylum novogranatense]|uniref:4-(hydroxymethyl)-2-furancarboxaldehyde-phosphate synthase n=1 Tax=Erythroxylum novogranatense TaxID=1862640 RepID=A0AAV8T0D0_9ROSI|nr:hypothetical protein K2173_009806 [Erythroxylum novogranatense]
MELGADFIDIKFKKTPSTEDIGDLVAAIQATGVDIVKVATTALDITDNAQLLSDPIWGMKWYTPVVYYICVVYELNSSICNF